MAAAIYNAIKGSGAISGGLSVCKSGGAAENAKTAVLKYGANLDGHTSKQISIEDIENSKLVITMTSSHKSMLLSAVPQFSDKIMTLAEFAGENKDVLDPFGGDIFVYKKTAEMIYDYINKALNKIEIRLANNNDADEIAAFEENIFPDFWKKQSVLEEIEKEKILVAIKEEKVCGYCIFMQAADEGEILKIAVNPQVRKMGIGKKLLEKTLSHLKELGAQVVYLEVRKSNLNAILLYEKVGFVKVRERKNYYSDSEDALIYTLKIKDR